MLVKLSNCTFNLSLVEMIRPLSGAVVLSFRDRTVTVSDGHDVEALTWMLTPAGMACCAAAADRSGGLVDLNALFEQFKSDHKPQAAPRRKVKPDGSAPDTRAA
jgi:hypothetical protein